MNDNLAALHHEIQTWSRQSLLHSALATEAAHKSCPHRLAASNAAGASAVPMIQ